MHTRLNWVWVFKLLGLGAAISVVVIIHRWQVPTTGDTPTSHICLWAASWLKAGLLSAAITSGSAYLAFVLSAIGCEATAAADKWTLRLLRLGVLLGLLWTIGAALCAAFGLTAGADQIHTRDAIPRMSTALLILAVVVVVVDVFLFVHKTETRRIIVFDILVLVALAIMYQAAQWYSTRLPHHDSYVLGFVAGGMAFQVILANLLFDPSTYSLKNLLPSATDAPRNRAAWMAAVILLTIVIVVLLLALRPAPGGGKNRITLGIATWPGFGAGFIGQQRGFFGDLALEFKVMDDSNVRHTAFLSGQIDVMISSADVFVQERAQGLDGVIFLVTDESFGADGVVAKSGITKASDLEGKKVAFARATPSHYLLYKILERAGLPPQKIKQVVMEDPGSAGQAFVGGSCDAAVTWEPLLSQVQETGRGRVLITTRELPGTIVDVLVASRTLAGDRDRLERLVRGWMRSIRFIEAQPSEAARIIAQGFGIPPEEARKAMAGVRFAGDARNRYFLCPQQSEPNQLHAVMSDAARFWQSQGIIPHLPSLDENLTQIVCETRVY